MRAAIPLPLQIVVDDVGWWSGRDDHLSNGPFRTGMPRDHVPADYLAIVRLGEALGMRPQAPFILGEWDTHGRLRDLPESQWMGRDWDNARWVGPWLDEAAAIVRENADHLELTLHGLGHEYWLDGKATRAEWHDMANVMRPRRDVLAHLEMFARLLEDHRLGGFPQSFVPCAARHRFGSGADGIDPLLRRFGVRYTSTPYDSMTRDFPTQHARFGIDEGVVTVDRGSDLVLWNVVAPEPAGEIVDAVCGMHWPHLLHPDPARNAEVVDRWVALLRPYRHRLDRELSANTPAWWSQLAHHAGVAVSVRGNTIDLDFTALDRLPAAELLDSFTLKLDGAAAIEPSNGSIEVLRGERDPVSGHLVLRLRRAGKAPSATMLAR